MSTTPAQTKNETLSHTPGSWDSIGIDGTYVIDAKQGRVDIARLYLRGTHEETEANARLIASAPDLLQALIDVRQAYQDMFDVMPVAWQTFDHIASAAIAKATGKQP